jgi:citronellol/citronellal dehydrogenase
MNVLDGRVAIVTGASRGIGAQIARRFAAAGAAVAVVARTTEPGASPLAGTIGETVDQIRAAGGTAVAVAADVSKPADRERLVEQATRQLGPPDILVNNAAVTYFVRVEDFTPRRYALMFEVQVQAPFHLATLVLPGMREKGAGWILNISSVAARHPAMPPGAGAARGGTVCGMCTGALERFSTGLAAELYPDNIAVNALSPNRVVPTPGTVFHRLTTQDDPDAEPPAATAEPALMLGPRDPDCLSGRLSFSLELLRELGVPLRGSPYSRAARARCRPARSR